MRGKLFICIAMVALMSTAHCFHLFKKHSAFDYLFPKTLSHKETNNLTSSVVQNITTARIENITAPTVALVVTPKSTVQPSEAPHALQDEAKRAKKSIETSNQTKSIEETWTDPESEWASLVKSLFPENIEDFDGLTPLMKRSSTANKVALNQQKIAEEDRKLRELRCELAKIQRDLEFLKAESRKIEALAGTNPKVMLEGGQEPTQEESYPFDRSSPDYISMHPMYSEHKRDSYAPFYHQQPMQELKEFENSFHPKFAFSRAFFLPRFQHMMQRKSCLV